MDAKALLQGMGWREGQGLGKSNQGISQAIKPKVQSDRNGLGLNPAASLVEPWWAKVFNQTAKGVKVNEVIDSRASQRKRLKTNAEDFSGHGSADYGSSDSSRETKKKKRNQKESSIDGATQNIAVRTASESNTSVDSHIMSIRKNLYLGSFTKAATLDAVEESIDQTASNVQPKNSTHDELGGHHRNPIDDHLWKRCKGRTAHKGARYGVLKGKLARLVRQEEEMAATVNAFNCDTKRIK